MANNHFVVLPGGKKEKEDKIGKEIEKLEEVIEIIESVFSRLYPMLNQVGIDKDDPLLSDLRRTIPTRYRFQPAQYLVPGIDLSSAEGPRIIKSDQERALQGLTIVLAEYSLFREEELFGKANLSARNNLANLFECSLAKNYPEENTFIREYHYFHNLHKTKYSLRKKALTYWFDHLCHHALLSDYLEQVRSIKKDILSNSRHEPLQNIQSRLLLVEDNLAHNRINLDRYSKTTGRLFF